MTGGQAAVVVGTGRAAVRVASGPDRECADGAGSIDVRDLLDDDGGLPMARLVGAGSAQR